MDKGGHVDTENTENGPQPLGTAALVANGANESGMERIRDLLFGNKARDLERMVQQVHEDTQRTLTDLQRDFQNRLDTLEHTARSEIEELSARVEERTQERQELLRRLRLQHQESFEHLIASLGELQTEVSKSIRDIRTYVQNELKRLSALQNEVRDQLREDYVRQLHSLSTEKLDRQLLVSVLSELALALQNAPVRESPTTAAHHH